MHSNKRAPLSTLRSCLILLAPLALGACVVPKQVVEERDAEVASCLAEMSQTFDQLIEAQAKVDLLCPGGNPTACLDTQQQLQSDLASCRAERRAEPVRLKPAEELAAREVELRERLGGDIANQSVEVERGDRRLAVRVLDSVLFNSGDTGMLPAGQALLDRIAPVLIAGSAPVRVEGHTDDIPVGPRLNTRFYSNWELSSARASAVVRYFQDRHGMAPERLQAVGLAQYYPAASNDTPEGRQRNRRVEIVLLPTSLE